MQWAVHKEGTAHENLESSNRQGAAVPNPQPERKCATKTSHDQAEPLCCTITTVPCSLPLAGTCFLSLLGGVLSSLAGPNLRA